MTNLRTNLRTKLLALLLLLAAVLLVGCGGDEQDDKLSAQTYALPQYDGFLAEKIIGWVPLLNDDGTEVSAPLLGYYNWPQGDGNPLVKMVIYNPTNQKVEDIYTGKCEFDLFNMQTRVLEGALLMQPSMNSQTVLAYDGANREIIELPMPGEKYPERNMEYDWAVALDGWRYWLYDDTDGLQLFYDNTHFGIKNIDETRIVPQNILMLPSAGPICDYAVSRNFNQLALLSWYGTVIVHDVNADEDVKVSVTFNPPRPEGWVDYFFVDYTADQKALVLTVSCEDKTVYQVVDAQTGKLLIEYEGSQHSELRDVYGDYLLLADGDKFGGELLLWNYKNGQQQVIYDVPTDFTAEFGADAYISSAKITEELDGGYQAAILLYTEDDLTPYLVYTAKLP